MLYITFTAARTYELSAEGVRFKNAALFIQSARKDGWAQVLYFYLFVQLTI